MQFHSHHFTTLLVDFFVFLLLVSLTKLFCRLDSTYSSIVCPVWSHSSTAPVFSFYPSCQVVASLIPYPPPCPFSRLSPCFLQFPSLGLTQPAPGVCQCSALWNSTPPNTNLSTPLNRHSLERRFVANILICIREGKEVVWFVKGPVCIWSVSMPCAECNEKRMTGEK